MKTKHLFFTAILLLSALFVSAEPVDPTRALETAEQFLPKKSQARRIKSRTAPEQSYEIVYTHRMPNSDRAAFYVVKLGEKGFVIISADDVANPILGYSYTNSWPTSISAEGDTLLPPQVLSYLNDMALQIETAIEKYPNLESSEEWNNVGQKAVRKISARKSADALPDSVGPLLTTTWGQGQYYNALCPEDAKGEDGHVSTGCVATAMAQIINYWGQKEEIKTRGIHSYDSQYGNLRVNYDSTFYDFSNMPDALTAESTPEQINAVAKLMYECGVAVNMQYSAWGSGAQNTDVIGAAVNHFRFSPEIKECFRYDYSDQEWFLALKNNLSNNSPIYYSGIDDWCTGHAFVCDGYNEMDYFHINFGWNGYCDGWYNLSAVSTEIGFVHYQSAILSIYPKDSSILSGQNNVSIIITESVEIQSNIIDYNSSEWVTMSFISADPTKQLVLDILDSHFQNLFIYDGLSTDIACNTDKQTPIVSSNYAFTLVFLCRNVETIHLRITPESNCRTVGNVETQIEDSTIYLSWQEYGGDTQWLVEYGLEGFKLGTGTQHIVSTNYISINQAVGDDAYEIRIQPICDTLYDDCVYSVIVNERKFWNDIVKSEPHGYYLDKNGTIHISTAEGLAWISNCAINDPNSNYLKNNISIEADIDLSGYYWSPLVEWKGNLYGNGHIISNMHIINRPGEWPYGSYSHLGFISNYLGETINDIGFINTTVVGKGNEDAATIVGNFGSGNIYNSYSKNCHIQTTGFHAGGLVGSGMCNLYNCYTTGCITSYNRPSASSGGIVGRSEGTMYNCYASVNVQSNKKAWRGLLCANSPTGYYENCYAEKDKYSTSFIDCIEQLPETKNIAYFSIENSGFAHITTEGAINYSLGDIDLVTALNYGVEKYNSPELKTWILDSITGLPKFGNYYNVTCPNVSDIKLQNIVHNDKDAVIISWTENGEASEWQIKYLREGQNNDSAIYINTSSTQDTLCGIELGYVYKFYVRPLCDNNGVENWGVSVAYMVDKPYWDEIVTTQPEGYVVDAFGNIKITSAEGLTWLSVCSNGLHGQPMNHYEGKKIEILTDIDLKGYRWRPIGQDFGNGSDTSFKGYFNGNHYTISNLYCNEYNKMATCGFFGSAWNAIIHNINLSNCCVYGNGNAGGLIGLLADSEVNNCHVNGVAKGLQGVGLLVGYLWQEETVIENSSVGGDIYGDMNCGGLIGYAYAPKSKITNCYANVNVFQRGIIKDVRNLGGLVGLVSNSDISNCYTAGDVEVIISDTYGIVSGSIFGSVEYQMHLQNIYTNRAELPWCAFSYTECDTCISNIGLFDDKGIFQEVLNKSSNHPNNLLDALNVWVDANNSEGQYLHWVADTAGVNGGFPIFAEEDMKYIITFCNDDGTILQQDTLELGEMPEYRGEIPTKDSTEQYNYTFIGWDQEFVPVTKNVTYHAQYEETLNQYEVTFLNWDGSVLQSTMVNYGEMPSYTGITPTRESDAQYTYTFTGWGDMSIVTGAQSYTAQYEATLNQYEVIFYNWDRSVLQSTMVNYGELPAYEAAIPTKPEDEHYVYTFFGWEPKITIVISEAEYTAQYEATEKTNSSVDNAIIDQEKPHKVFIDGKLFIIHGEHIYSGQGHQIK